MQNIRHADALIAAQFMSYLTHLQRRSTDAAAIDRAWRAVWGLGEARA